MKLILHIVLIFEILIWLLTYATTAVDNTIQQIVQNNCGPRAIRNDGAACECNPPFHGTYPNCLGPDYLSPTIINVNISMTQRCSNGTIGHPPNCYKPCGPKQMGRHPNCYTPCPMYYTGHSEPNCTKMQCPNGWKGDYQPNCIPPETCRKYGKIGKFPDCYDAPAPKKKCPHHQYGNYPNCSTIPCPNGWTGKQQPHCKPPPSICPPGYIGTYPDCQKLYCPSGTIGHYPNCEEIEVMECNCKCPPGTSGTVPFCRCNNGGIPPECKLLSSSLNNNLCDPFCPMGSVGTPPFCTYGQYENFV